MVGVHVYKYESNTGRCAREGGDVYGGREGGERRIPTDTDTGRPGLNGNTGRYAFNTDTAIRVFTDGAP